MPARYARISKKRLKRSASSIKQISRRRPTASNQKSQLMSLSKKVNTLARKQSNISERVYYQKTWDANVSANYASHTLVTPANWINVFGQSDNVTESRKINISRMFLDFALSPNNEHSEVDYTIFLVAPRNNQVMRETNAMTQFTVNGDDYTYNNGIVFMNPKRFKIYKVWRLKTDSQLTLINTTTQALSATAMHTHRRTFSMPFRKQIRNSTGVWTAIGNDEIPVSSALTIIAFNNNSAVDLENPNFRGTCHWTCYV